MLRSVVVTGAGSGIGQAVALRLIADGWAVVAVDRDGPPMTAALQLAIDAGRPVTTVIGDVADRETHREAGGRRWRWRRWGPPSAAPA